MTVASLVSSRLAISIAERNTTSSRCCTKKSAARSSAGDSPARAAEMRSSRLESVLVPLRGCSRPWLLAVVFTSPPVRNCSVYCEGSQGRKRRGGARSENTMDTLPTIELSGSHREVGRQHGEAARAQIRDSIAYYRESFKKITGLEWSEIKQNAPRWVDPI